MDLGGLGWSRVGFTQGLLLLFANSLVMHLDLLPEARKNYWNPLKVEQELPEDLEGK